MIPVLFIKILLLGAKKRFFRGAPETSREHSYTSCVCSNIILESGNNISDRFAGARVSED